MAPEETAGALDPQLVQRLARVELVALDVDGTLTDGRVVYGGSGESDELQVFDVRDGFGLRCLLEAGLSVVWITGRGCAATRRRADELGISELLTRAGPKDEALARVQERLGIDPERTLAMGDDLPDLVMRRRAGLFATVADGRIELRACADLVTDAAGGAGAVRELAEHLLRARGRWREIVGAHGG